EECTICKSTRLLQDIFSQIHHFSDPISEKNDYYATLNNVYSNSTTEIYCPSLVNSKNNKKSQLKLKNSMLFNSTAQKVKNVDTIDYYCGSSFCNAENLFGIQNQTSLQLINKSKLEVNIELKSESKLVADAKLESESELVIAKL
ncbi:7848_t:CDS:2, partial [Cetraspora pellucida]